MTRKRPASGLVSGIPLRDRRLRRTLGAMHLDDKPPVKTPLPPRPRRRRMRLSPMQLMIAWSIASTSWFLTGILDLPEWWRFLARIYG